MKVKDTARVVIDRNRPGGVDMAARAAHMRATRNQTRDILIEAINQEPGRSASELTRMTGRQATNLSRYESRGLVRSRRQDGLRRWYPHNWRFSDDPKKEAAPDEAEKPLPKKEQRPVYWSAVKAFLAEHPHAKAHEVKQATGFPKRKIDKYLSKYTSEGKIIREGEYRHYRYSLPGAPTVTKEAVAMVKEIAKIPSPYRQPSELQQAATLVEKYAREFLWQTGSYDSKELVNWLRERAVAEKEETLNGTD